MSLRVGTFFVWSDLCGMEVGLRFTFCSENGRSYHFFKKYRASVGYSLHVNSNLTAKLGSSDPVIPLVM